MRTAVLLAVAVLATAWLAGCGQKGPLVLPDAQHPRKKISMPKPATAPAPAANPTAPVDGSDPGTPKPTPAPQQ
jgi:predicted small lipoprotein YifL